jgi:hypothetical protein
MLHGVVEERRGEERRGERFDRNQVGFDDLSMLSSATQRIPFISMQNILLGTEDADYISSHSRVVFVVEL